MFASLRIRRSPSLSALAHPASPDRALLQPSDEPREPRETKREDTKPANSARRAHTTLRQIGASFPAAHLLLDERFYSSSSACTLWVLVGSVPSSGRVLAGRPLLLGWRPSVRAPARRVGLRDDLHRHLPPVPRRGPPLNRRRPPTSNQRRASATRTGRHMRIRCVDPLARLAVAVRWCPFGVLLALCVCRLSAGRRSTPRRTVDARPSRRRRSGGRRRRSQA